MSRWVLRGSCGIPKNTSRRRWVFQHQRWRIRPKCLKSDANKNICITFYDTFERPMLQNGAGDAHFVVVESAIVCLQFDWALFLKVTKVWQTQDRGAIVGARDKTLHQQRARGERIAFQELQKPDKRWNTTKEFQCTKVIKKSILWKRVQQRLHVPGSRCHRPGEDPKTQSKHLWKPLQITIQSLSNNKIKSAQRRKKRQSRKMCQNSYQNIAVNFKLWVTQPGVRISQWKQTQTQNGVAWY